MTIKPLTYNVATLPEAIYKSFCSFGYTFSNGFDLSEAPFKMSIKLKDNENEYICFFLTYKEFEYFYNQIDNKKLFDIDNNLIDRKAANDYLIAFAKGIENGYANFLDKIKSDNELFTPENKDLAYKVYSKTIISFNNRLGSVNCFSTNKENNKYITTEMLFEQGVLRGEHYKAWELILKNPMQFEQFFKAATEQPAPTTESTPKPFSGAKIIEIYDPIKVHKEFKNELKCDYNTFKAWFVDSVICDKQMSWNYDNGNKDQLRTFLYHLCFGWKPLETNTAFKIKVDSQNRETTKLNPVLQQRLEKCTFK